MPLVRNRDFKFAENTGREKANRDAEKAAQGHGRTSGASKSLFALFNQAAGENNVVPNPVGNESVKIVEFRR